MALSSVLMTFFHVAIATPSFSGPSPASNIDKVLLAHELFIDRLLEDPSREAVLYDEFSILKVCH